MNAWEKRKLDDLSRAKIGGGTPSTKASSYWNGDLPWIQSSDIDGSKKYSVTPRKFVSPEGLQNSAAKRIPANSIAVVTRVGVGKLALIGFDYSTSQDFLSFVSLNWSASFSVNLLTLVMSLMSHEGQGTSIKGVTKSELLARKVRVPNLFEEQEKIGSLLRALDNLIAATQGKLDQLEMVKRALLQHLFDQSMRFKGYSDPWEKRKLGTLAPLRGGFAFQSAEFKKSGVPIVRISNIKSDGTIGGDFVYYQEKKNDNAYSLPLNATLLAMSGATTGKVAVLRKKFEGKVYQNQRVGYFSKVNGISYRFISVLVESTLFLNQLKSVLVAGAQPNVSAKEVDQFKFNVPNSLNEQISVGKLFESLDKLIAATQSKLVDYQQLKKSLLQELFV